MPDEGGLFGWKNWKIPANLFFEQDTTPAKVSPDDNTPAKVSPDDNTPAKVSPDDNTPAKVSPDDTLAQVSPDDTSVGHLDAFIKLFILVWNKGYRR